MLTLLARSRFSALFLLPQPCENAHAPLRFDTYGTLIDWETGIWDALQPLCMRPADPPTREVALAAFAQAESACQFQKHGGTSRPAPRRTDLGTKAPLG